MKAGRDERKGDAFVVIYSGDGGGSDSSDSSNDGGAGVHFGLLLN